MVEDLPDMIDLIKEVILAGIDAIDLTAVAFDAPTGIESIRLRRPQIILVDLHLANDTSGFEVLRAAQGIDPGIAVVLMTNMPDPDLEKEARRLGARYFIDKSELDHLRMVLRDLAAAAIQE